MKLDVLKFGNSVSGLTGKNILLIHPFPFDARLWVPVAQKLGEKNYVLVPNLRGCGQTELGTEEPDLVLLAEDIAALISEENLTKVVIVGISLGGYVAMTLAKTNSDLISGLILLDTKAGQDSPEAKENRLRIANLMQTKVTKPRASVTSVPSTTVSLFATQMLENVVGKFTQENKPQIVHQVKSWMLDAKLETIAWLQLAMVKRQESFTTLANLNIPTLLIRGEQDRISSVEDFAMMQKNLRQVTYIELANVGHLPPVEDPHATYVAIDQWLTTFAN